MLSVNLRPRMYLQLQCTLLNDMFCNLFTHGLFTILHSQTITEGTHFHQIPTKYTHIVPNRRTERVAI